jgi:hypothetical protein
MRDGGAPHSGSDGTASASGAARPIPAVMAKSATSSDMSTRSFNQQTV